MKPLFHNFVRNIVHCFKGFNLVWILIAIFITFISVVSGFDWYYFINFKDGLIYKIFFPAVVIGGFLPIVIPLTLLIYGKIKRNKKILNVGYALVQAVMLGWLISSFLKSLTGRIPPPMTLVSNAIDISRGFRFGILEGGIFWGWPSSHTTIAFAMAVTLATLYAKKKSVEYIAVIYAVYIGIGISMSIHWFSEFIAGAIIGTIIGIVVGKSFKDNK
jgi:membrane-associated phospholipid phosphatase